MRYALIGCGRVAPNHITAAKENGLDIVAICDLDQQKAEAFAREQQLPETVAVYTDYEQLMEEAKPELVAIATWSGTHAKIALAAIRRKIHVIVEKPIALSLDDADQMIREAAEHQVKLCTNHQNRFNPVIRLIRQAVEEGRIGKMLYGTAHVRWYRDKAYFDQDTRWRGTWEQDGGALMNQCIHDADLLRWMMGDEITEVFAYTDNLAHPYIEVEDLGIATIRFANGGYGVFEGTTVARPAPTGLEETLYLFGSEGTLKAGGLSVNRLEAWEVPGEEKRLPELQKACDETPENVYGHGHTPLYRDMLEAIRDDRAPLVDGSAGRRALELILGIYESSRTHQPVKFPLKGIKTTDFIR